MLKPAEQAERSVTRNELSLGTPLHTRVSLELPIETMPPPKVAVNPAATTAAPAPPSTSAPAEATTTTAPVSPSSTGVGDQPTPTTSGPAPTTTTTTAPVPAPRCTLSPAAAAKLDVPAELAPHLEAGPAFDVVVALEAPQSTSPQLEQQLRVASLANFAALGVERFTALDGTHVQVRLSGGQVCRLAYLRPVVGLQVRLPAG
ncbi:MAG: hypothetical protein R2755_22970 [Acidimicrobiales bacterium]